MKSSKIGPESVAHIVKGKACGLLFDVTPPLALAVGVKHVKCNGCGASFALRIGEGR